jgi:hypothetical protein
MKWISKDPPLYVWEGDIWYNERNKKCYDVNIKENAWVNLDEKIPFPKKTKIYA